MRAQLVEKEGVNATVKVTVPASKVDEKFAKVLRQLSRQVKVPGFRPGKAPEGVLIKRIGAESLAQEVRDALMDDHYPEAVRELDLSPVHAHFHAEAPERGQEFEFEVHVDLYPDFELPPFEEIVMDTEVPRVTDDMIQQTVERLQRENATLVPVDRPSQPGDTVMIETIVEGAEEEDAGSQMPVDLESVDEAVAEQLLGMTIGDTVELQLGGGEGAGEDESTESEPTRTLRVKITNVQEKDKPAADDEFAKTLGFESWEETVEQIRASIRTQLERDASEEQREEFVEKLIAHTDFDLPPSLVNRRKVNLLENLADDLRQRNLTLQQYMSGLEEKGTREEFETELTEAAERGVRRDLLLERLLEQQGTEVTDTEFQQALRQLASREGKDVQRFMRERDESWLTNYRFLLARDKALREVVRERTGAGDPTPSAAVASVTSEDDAAHEEIVDAGSAPPAPTVDTEG